MDEPSNPSNNDERGFFQRPIGWVVIVFVLLLVGLVFWRGRWGGGPGGAPAGDLTLTRQQLLETITRSGAKAVSAEEKKEMLKTLEGGAPATPALSQKMRQELLDSLQPSQ